MTLQIIQHPESVIALNRELASGLHPELERKIADSECTTAADRLAVVATHCSVALDGWYSGADLEKLCAILYEKLQDKRQLPANSNLILH